MSDPSCLLHRSPASVPRLASSPLLLALVNTLAASASGGLVPGSLDVSPKRRNALLGFGKITRFGRREGDLRRATLTALSWLPPSSCHSWPVPVISFPRPSSITSCPCQFRTIYLRSTSYLFTSISTHGTKLVPSRMAARRSL